MYYALTNRLRKDFSGTDHVLLVMLLQYLGKYDLGKTFFQGIFPMVSELEKGICSNNLGCLFQRCFRHCASFRAAPFLRF